VIVRTDGEPDNATMWVEDDPPRDCVEQLFIRMISTALLDLAREGKTNGADAKYRKIRQRKSKRTARNWFSTATGAVTFQMACEGLGMDFDTMRRQVLGLSAEQVKILVERIRALERRPSGNGV